MPLNPSLLFSKTAVLWSWFSPCHNKVMGRCLMQTIITFTRCCNKLKKPKICSAGGNLCQYERNENQTWLFGKSCSPLWRAGTWIRGSCGQKSKAGLSAALLCPALGCSRCSSELMTALLLCLSFLQIVDDHGAVVPTGEEGTIAVRVQPTRPFCLFSEYLVSPAGCACVCWETRQRARARLCQEQNCMQDPQRVSLGYLRTLNLVSVWWCWGAGRS